MPICEIVLRGGGKSNIDATDRKRRAAGAFLFGWAMGCRCAERRTAITKALKATAQGDRTTVTNQLSFVARTSVEDAQRTMRPLVHAARARLGALRR